MNDVERRVKELMQREDLFPQEGTVLVAVSGGADSVALLRILLNLGVPCAAAHCNFHLRGEESLRDERFVEGLCSSLSVKLHKIDFDTWSYSRSNHISIEMAARELRYRFFERLLEDEGYAYVAVAHHLDDNVETVLLNLVRGTGLRGLAGMKYRNGAVVRPLLDICRKEIVDYLAGLKQEYVTDSTNLVADVMRNKVRLQLLPLMETLNPSVKRSVNGMIGHLSDAEEYLSGKIQEDKSYVAEYNKEELRSIDVFRMDERCRSQLLLFELLSPLGFNSAQINDIYRSRYCVGKTFQTSLYTLLVDRNTLLVRPVSRAGEESVDVWQEGMYGLNGINMRVTSMAMKEMAVIPKERNRVAVDADRLVFPLKWRTIRTGDRFQPYGMKGRKLVSDYLTDCKVPRFEKERQSVVCSGDEIVWLVGHRVSQRFAVSPTQTKKVILLELI